MRNKNDLIYSHAINCAGGFGPQRFKKLLARFGDFEAAWKAPREDLLDSGIGEKHTEDLLKFRGERDPKELFEELLKENIGMIALDDGSYPPLLKDLASAPYLIYVRGNRDILSDKSLAVVGSRKFTEYGKRATEKLCRDLVRAGLTIVSGLALGIDAIAHRETLDAGGTTIAVLGTGIDDETIYPRDNFNLAKSIIASGGALITEYPPKTPSLKQNFPARNRIMAGLSLGTLVVEAAFDSGSLITAGLALEFGREVFAVPGSVFSAQSEGANYLIKNGAKLASSSSDILEELRLGSPAKKSSASREYEPKSEEEKKLWNVIGTDPLHVDRISKMTKLNPAIVNSVLAMMEIQGAVRNIGGQNYIKM